MRSQQQHQAHQVLGGFGARAAGLGPQSGQLGGLGWGPSGGKAGGGFGTQGHSFAAGQQVGQGAEGERGAGREEVGRHGIAGEVGR
ncbi:hypothetical protein BEN49_16780 [Hymenobacter coccineus]|uniref:Uncharacterized protein n=1 Tax=Hymenobacter coccineus TaxID=1908235 RepID=A0A1G1TMX1_9BACT|nr:hypothetical protein BEN49_16780 [Hymenobacter coccineus]